MARVGELNVASMETFIQAHIERLPGRVKVVYGTENLFSGENGEALGPSLFPFLVKHKIDAVLAEFGWTGVRLMEACSEAEVPLIVHFHGVDAYSDLVIHRFGVKYQRLFSLSSALVSPSHPLEKQLIRLGAHPDKIHYNPCGVDVECFAGAAPEKAPPLFVAVGRFVEKKAPHLTLMAFRKTLDKLPDARLVMIGDGPMRVVCENLADTLRVRDRIAFKGVCSQAEIATTLRSARAFVQHSITATDGDSEASPVSLKEAGTAALPVVSTCHGGIPEMVIHGETGFLVAERDVDGMANHMILLGKEPELASRLGRAAARWVAEHFSMDQAIAKLSRIIGRVVGG